MLAGHGVWRWYLGDGCLEWGGWGSLTRSDSPPVALNDVLDFETELQRQSMVWVVQR